MTSYATQKQPMKRFPFTLLILVLVFPILLAACGGGPKGNAEDFINAIADNDKDKAKDASCDDFSNEIDVLWEDATDDDDATDLECEEDGDDVRCTFKDQEDTEVVFVFAIEDDKVCGIKSVQYDGQDTGFSLSSDAANN